MSVTQTLAEPADQLSASNASAPSPDCSGPQTSATGRLYAFFRWILFLYLSWILCPIRYYVPSRLTTDNTWYFALNYAASHHLLFGRDIVWTYGPLAYLLVPFHIGPNLALGLLFQAVLWALLIIALWDLFILSRIAAPNLQIFAIFVALSSIDYFQDVYPGNLLLPLALIFLVHFHLRGGTARLVAALVLLGLAPLFQFVGSVVAVGIAGGLVVHRLLSRQPDALRETILALVVPPLVAGIGLWAAIGSLSGILSYVRSSKELAQGYAFAMSFPGSPKLSNFTFEVFALLVAVFVLLYLLQPKTAQFFALILCMPIFFELRHGVVRQDESHVTQFFCFAALALGLMALAVPFRRRTVEIVAVLSASLCFALWWHATTSRNLNRIIDAVTGTSTSTAVWNALHYHSLADSLDLAAQQDAAEFGLEPRLQNIVGQQSIAFLSPQYSDALAQHFNLALLPVIQSYSAYTPYLDDVNARWIASRGPQFLTFEYLSIDDRHLWTESPGTWAEIYRWYSTRAVGDRYLLLERRQQPRFARFEFVASRDVQFGEVIPFPQSQQPLFWTLNCSLSTQGKLGSALFRVPEVIAIISLRNGHKKVFRSILPVLQSPSPGTYLPVNLARFAEVFSDQPNPDFSVVDIKFAGPGTSSYQPTCHMQFLQTAP